ncbi:hypothetical protein AVEN_233176-1 [Araneus ventricosus]|uniref:Uncharacterized protein n=1 Tax=Araneus ventricosus TaxID=182803 RepID=A0A4Y2EGP5_ARAVE|nr:hypothetical protein AVEN_233176-1 [Araneus ventricosus]
MEEFCLSGIPPEGDKNPEEEETGPESEIRGSTPAANGDREMTPLKVSPHRGRGLGFQGVFIPKSFIPSVHFEGGNNQTSADSTGTKYKLNILTLIATRSVKRVGKSIRKSLHLFPSTVLYF